MESKYDTKTINFIKGLITAAKATNPNPDTEFTQGMNQAFENIIKALDGVKEMTYQGVSMYEGEEMIHWYRKIRSLARYKEMENCPEIILKCKEKELEKAFEKYPNLLNAYKEYEEIKDKTTLYVKPIELKDTVELEDENGPYVINQFVYQVTNRECGKNVMGGMLFDTEDLALAHWYRIVDVKHPEFDKMIKYEIDTNKLLNSTKGEC